MKSVASNLQLFATVVITVTLLGSQASAQYSGMLEEIIVTAQKREQSLLEVPQAVTVVGMEDIKDRAVRDIKGMQFSIPSLYITNNGPGQDRIQMRGISPGAQGLPAVGVYLDEVGISLDQVQRNLAVPLVDLERVEVLRGPQGTLYGQGSMGVP